MLKDIRSITIESHYKEAALQNAREILTHS